MDYYKQHQMAVLDLILCKERQYEAFIQHKTSVYDDYIDMLVIMLCDVTNSILDKRIKLAFKKMLDTLRVSPTEKMNFAQKFVFINPEKKDAYLQNILNSDMQYAREIYNNIFSAKE